MQYKIGSATSWTNLNATSLNLKSYVSKTDDIPVQIRFASTSTKSASLPVTFTIPHLLAGPNCEVDHESQAIIGLTDGTAYQYYIGTNPAVTANWANITLTEGRFDISGLLTTSSRIINIRKAETTTSPLTDYTTLTLDAMPAAPSTPTFIYNDADNYDGASLTGVNSQMEYRLSTNSTWTPITSEKLYFDVPTTNYTYYVRYKPTKTNFASSLRSVYLTYRSSAPYCIYNTTTENLTGLGTSLEISFNNESYSPCTTSSLLLSDMINNIESGKPLTISVRFSAITTRPASAATIYTLYSRSATPENVTYNNTTIALNNTASGMQYKIGSATSWTNLNATSLNLKSYVSKTDDIPVQIRFAPTSTKSASLPVTRIIPHLLAGPECEIDYKNQAISGLTDGVAYQYYIGTNPAVTANWANVNVTNGNFDVSALITTSRRTINIRKAETETTPLTDFTTITLDAMPVAPSAPYVTYADYSNYDKAVILGVDSSMEYRLSSDINWTGIVSDTISLDIPNSSLVYYVRSKPTQTAFASSYKSLTIYSRGSLPSCSYNTATEQLTGLTSTMEMSINGSAYSGVTYNSIVLSDSIDGIESGSSLTLSIRYVATATRPASLPRVFTIYSRHSSPDSVLFNTTTNTLDNLSTGMQYKIGTATAWTNINTTALNLQSYINGSNDITVQVRYAPTSTSSASNAVTIQIPHQLPAPTCELDFANQTIIGLTDGVSYQYVLGSNPSSTSTWTNIQLNDSKFDITNLIASSTQTINIRIAPTDTLPASKSAVITISSKPKAPNTPNFVYDNASYPGQAVLVGVDSSMQWKLLTGDTWTSINGAQVVFDIPSVDTVYMVRYTSTTNSFSSEIKQLTLLAQTPTVISQSLTEESGTIIQGEQANESKNSDRTADESDPKVTTEPDTDVQIGSDTGVTTELDTDTESESDTKTESDTDTDVESNINNITQQDLS
jgi:hypothetical protein